MIEHLVPSASLAPHSRRIDRRIEVALWKPACGFPSALGTVGAESPLASARLRGRMNPNPISRSGPNHEQRVSPNRPTSPVPRPNKPRDGVDGLRDEDDVSKDVNVDVLFAGIARGLADNDDEVVRTTIAMVQIDQKSTGPQAPSSASRRGR